MVKRLALGTFMDRLGIAWTGQFELLEKLAGARLTLSEHELCLLTYLVGKKQQKRMESFSLQQGPHALSLK